MNKKANKFIAIIMALCLVLSFGVTASFAADIEVELPEITEEVVLEEATEELPPPVTEEVVLEEAIATEESAVVEQQTDGAGYVSGQIIVLFKGGMPAASMQSTAEQAGGAVLQAEALATGDMMSLVEIPPTQTVEQAVEIFSAMPDVLLAEPNYLFEAPKPEVSNEAGKNAISKNAVSTNDPLILDQWYLDKINLESAWNYVDIIASSEPDRKKVRVAVLDTSIDLNHEDIQGSINKELSVDTYNGKVSPPYGDFGDEIHGTHVGGTIGASTNNQKGVVGVANTPNKNIVDLVSVGAFGNDGSASSYNICIGINYAIGIKSDVINMSFVADPLIPYPEEVKAQEYMCDAAYSRGIIIVAAAGNENTQDSKVPSDFRYVISIIANDNWTDKGDARASFSNYGTHKDFSAPGVGIVNCTPYNDYDTSSGTSMAAPIVSGVVAMMKYIDPTLDMEGVYKTLKQTSTDLYKPGFDIYSGWGEINAGAAVEKILFSQIIFSPITGLKAASNGYNSVKLSWDAYDFPEAEYIVYKNSTEFEYDDTKFLPIATVAANSFVDKNMVSGKSASYKVALSMGGAMEGTISEQVVITPVCAAPKNLKLKSVGKDTATLTWDKVAGATGYYVYRATSKTGKYVSLGKISSNSFKDKGLASKSKYYYKVFAYNVNTDNKIMRGKAAGPVLVATK